MVDGVVMADSDSMRSKVVKGTGWAILERFGVQAVSFCIALVLARLLTPTDYGTVALLSVFILLSNVIVDSGLGQALVQKKEIDALSVNSVFYTNIAISIFVYICLFFLAPFIARFYSVDGLEMLLRVLALNVIINGINDVQNAALSRHMLFRKSFFIGILSCATSAIVGIIMALYGYGAWALVTSSVVSNLVGMIARWYIIAWRPAFMFSFNAVRGLWRFGWKLTISALIDISYSNLYALLIGKLYSKADLAYVNKGRGIPQFLLDSINGPLGRVVFPVFSRMQCDVERLKSAMRRSLRFVSFFVFPFMTLCAICADSIVKLLLGEQWGAAVPYVRLSCFSLALLPFHTINLQAITALGRSDVFLALEIVKKVLGLFFLLVSISRGVYVFCFVATFVTGPLSLLVNTWPNRKFLKYSVVSQIRDVVPAFLASAMMAAFVVGIGFLHCNFICKLLLQGVLGLTFYFAVGVVFRFGALQESLSMILPFASGHLPQLLVRGLKSIDGYLHR